MGAIIGGVAGGIVVLILIIIGIRVMINSKKQKEWVEKTSEMKSKQTG